ncbi:unnamed protein product [Arabidopsis arenosa]|uniref:Nodulin-like domain-containing protein n=1 Tax=Arabidopsis arenosa TaxID=38785 RepID=A0A8S2ALN6_ARAAE|nr:unnamed protein product [Arabidopsis arenosa]
MASTTREKFVSFINNRWLVFVAAMWIQSCAGIGYLFGSISPVIKSSLNYNQKELARLGVAKDLGDSVGFIAGTLSEILPLWAALLVGAVQNLIGYGWVWLIVTGRAPILPLWAMCVLIFVGNNGETYFNTGALVSGVQNFPKSRGPVVGILKGFAGLGGAIISQIYTMIHSSNPASLILMVAVTPAVVVVCLMFFIRPVGGHKQIRPSDGASFTFIYGICLLLAAYLMAVMLIQDLVVVSHNVITVFFTETNEPDDTIEEPLVPKREGQEPGMQTPDLILTNAAAAEGAVRVKRRRGPHRGGRFHSNAGNGESRLLAHILLLAARFCIWNFLGRIAAVISPSSLSGTMRIQDRSNGCGSANKSVGHIFSTASELFGLKKFGALYNFLTLANPAGSLVFSDDALRCNGSICFLLDITHNVLDSASSLAS